MMYFPILNLSFIFITVDKNISDDIKTTTHAIFVCFLCYMGLNSEKVKVSHRKYF